MQGSLFCQLDAAVCNWGIPWRVQMVCDHYHCDWCWLVHRFGAVGDLFSGLLNGKVVHGDVS